jgi:hypothetical protein
MLIMKDLLGERLGEEIFFPPFADSFSSAGLP